MPRLRFSRKSPINFLVGKFGPFQGNALFSYNDNRWWLVILSMLGASVTRSDESSTSWSTPKKIGFLAQHSMIYEKQFSSRQVSQAKIHWVLGDARRVLEFQWPDKYDQVSLSFLSQRQPLQRVDTSRSFLGDQGFEIISEGKRIREPSQEVGQRSGQESFGAKSSERLAIGSDRESPSNAARLAVRLDEAVPRRTDADALFSSSCQAEPLGAWRLPWFEHGSLRSLEVWRGGQKLQEGLDWLLCGDELRVRAQGSLMDLRIRYQLPYVERVRLPWTLGDGKAPLSLQAFRQAEDGDWEPIAAHWDADALEFPEGILKADDKVRVVYEESVLTSDELRLPQVPDPSTVRWQASEAGCREDSFVLERAYIFASQGLASPCRLEVFYAFAWSLESGISPHLQAWAHSSRLERVRSSDDSVLLRIMIY